MLLSAITLKQKQTIKTMKTKVNEAIQAALIKYPKARKIAVENVSSWYRGTMQDSINLHYDAKSYLWNSDTLKANRFVYVLTNKL